MEGEPAGHEEPHEGFKVFIALPGEVNDERRVNRVFSRSVFHMGTGGPRRFVTRHHSADIRLIHPEFGLKAFTQLMMDTGGVGAVCDPRTGGPVKDVMQVNSPCRAAERLRDLDDAAVGASRTAAARSTARLPRRRCSIRSRSTTAPTRPR